MTDILYYQNFILGDKEVMYVRLERGLGRELRTFGEGSVPKAFGRSRPPLVTTSGRSCCFRPFTFFTPSFLLPFYATFYSDRLLWI